MTTHDDRYLFTDGSRFRLHATDCRSEGSEWIDCDDTDSSLIRLLRKGKSIFPILFALCDFTTVPRGAYRLSAPHGGFRAEVFNSDAAQYGGCGIGNLSGVEAQPTSIHGRPYSMTLDLPQVSVSYFRGQS
jgi:1,4-alpha-glucan branching enzyme